MKEVFTKQQLEHIMSESVRIQREAQQEIVALNKRIQVEKHNYHWAKEEWNKLEDLRIEESINESDDNG